MPFGLPAGNGPFTTHETTPIAHLLLSAYKADRQYERRDVQMLLEVTNLLLATSNRPAGNQMWDRRNCSSVRAPQRDPSWATSHAEQGGARDVDPLAPM